MVLEVGVQLALAVLPAAQQPAILGAQLAEHEVRRRARGVEVVVPLEHRARVGERGDHQRVPGGQPLVVEARPDALGAHVVEPLPPCVAALGLARPAHGDVPPLEVAAVGGAEPRDRLVGVRLALERGPHLLDAPDVELALLALGVGVERGVEAALGAAHLAERPVERLLGHGPEQRVARDLPAVQVRARQQRVVVEHLLEVGDEPVGVDRVAREAAADLVVHAARGHRAQRVGRHLGLTAAEQELDRRGGRELRRSPEAAVRAVVLAPEGLDCLAQDFLVEVALGRLQQGASTQPLGDPHAALADLVAALVPRARDRVEHRGPARHPHARIRREVGAGEERHLLGGEEDVQGPPALAGHGLAGLHVDRVEVRPLLAVELDAHEALVHERRGGGILERLALHDVAPVAGRVADREQNRQLPITRARERLLAPRIPIHRVVLVLKEVRRRLVGKPVRHRP